MSLKGKYLRYLSKSNIILRVVCFALFWGILFIIFLRILKNFSPSNKVRLYYDKDTTTLEYSSPKNKDSAQAIDVVVIFMNVGNHQILKSHLREAVGSLLHRTSRFIRLHIIADNSSVSHGKEVIEKIFEQNSPKKENMQVVFVNPEKFITQMEPEMKVLQNYFTALSYSKYRDFLFFFSVFFYHLLPGLTNVILMDIDVSVRADISELFSHFSGFSQKNVIGISHELSPVYRHVLMRYRTEHPSTPLGSPTTKGGFPGLNSGVLLINIPRLRSSTVFQSYLTREILEEKTRQYYFKGHLGDQDLFTLMAFDHPELFYILPCSWNRQLCQWWNIDLYKDIFKDFYYCKEPYQIFHGNCRSAIPEVL